MAKGSRSARRKEAWAARAMAGQVASNNWAMAGAQFARGARSSFDRIVPLVVDSCEGVMVC